MLLIGGGQETALKGIRNLTFLGALPFAVVMVLMCVALMKDLRNDPVVLRRTKRIDVLERAVTNCDESDGNIRLETAPVHDDPAPTTDTPWTRCLIPWSDRVDFDFARGSSVGAELSRRGTP